MTLVNSSTSNTSPASTTSTTPTTTPSTTPTPTTNTSTPAPAAPTLGEQYAQWSRDGWTDGELKSYISGIIDSGNVEPHLNPLWRAVLTPQMPSVEERDEKFFEVLAWYIDKSTSGAGDGKLTLREVHESLVKYGQQYLSLSGRAGQDVPRLQAWKFIQKLRILEKEIYARAERGEGAFYPYEPRAMMTIDSNSTFNRENTISGRADYEERVKEASYEKPVLIKFGLTYCAHCLLLEQLGSVPAVAERYADDMDVYKLWWNPHDTAYGELNAIAREEGVTSSPIFILYKDGEVVKKGYGFPDETGAGLEEFVEALEHNV